MPVMEIDPRQLRHALAVARHGSFVKASQALRITQPALSTSIQRLERQLNVLLFERSQRGTKPTPEGELLLRHATSMESVLQRVKDDFSLLSSGITASLRVGGTPMAMLTVVPPAIAALRREHGAIAATVLEVSDDELFDLLLTHKIDLAVCTLNFAPPHPDIEQSTLFYVDTISAIFSPGHRFAARKRISLFELKNEQFVLPPPGGAFRRQLEALFLVSGIEFPTKAIEAAPFSTLHEILSSTRAISLQPWQIVKPDITAGRFIAVPLREPAGHRSIGIRRLKGHALSPAMKRFCELLNLTAREFDDRKKTTNPDSSSGVTNMGRSSDTM